MIDANIYNLAFFNKEPFADPVLASQNDTSNAPETNEAYYLIDNICNERGILWRREITLPREPQEGDLLCMINTAAYASDFEDAQPHRLPLGKKLVVTKENENWDFCSEDQYWPFLEKEQNS
jgi:diaminopimelate decarboxylase